MQKLIMNFNKSKDKKKAEEYNKKKKLKKHGLTFSIPNNLMLLKKPNKLFEYRKIKRERDLLMNKKISEKNKKSKSIIFENLKKFENKNNLNNILISKQLRTQDHNILKKLNKRRQNSVSISTLSNSFKTKKKYKTIKKSYQDINIIEELEYFEQNVGDLDFDKEMIIKHIDKTKTAPKSINV